MDPLTTITTNFTLKQGTTPVAGTVTYVVTTATFVPISALAINTIYTATITTQTRDLAGNPLLNNFSWNFTTGASADVTAPTVILTDPLNAATEVAINQKIAATFSEVMDPLTTITTNFTLVQGTTPVAGTVVCVGQTAIITPLTVLAPNNTYTATVTTQTNDLAGNPLPSNFAWTFTTGAVTDTTRPSVSVTDPVDAATSVAVNKKVSVDFSEAMDPLTTITATFGLRQGTNPVIGTVTYIGTTATFTPSSDLAASTVYTATLTTGVNDLGGNALLSNYEWSFTTAGTTTGQAPVALGSATSFAVLASSTVTSTGATTVNGDLGVSPGTGLTGAPTVNGTTHLGDTVAAQAQLDLTTAYNDAAGRTVGSILVAGNLGGQTLAPGLYTSTSSLEISSGDLTLDAGGDANAVWIFQMGSTLTTTSGRQVILTGGAQASNIYWQVGSSATLGTTSVFKGTIMALASITLTTGATLDGRALARSGAVTLDGNTINLQGTVTGVGNGLAPHEFALLQNYPNPFNPTTRIQYSLAKASQVSLKVYDLLGHEVATIVNGRQDAGVYTMQFNTNKGTLSLPSGVYFYRLEAGSFISMKKLILMK
jgi:hypothetical protein